MTINQIYVEAFKGEKIGTVFSRQEIIKKIQDSFDVDEGSILPSDLCYNSSNIGVRNGTNPDNKRLFIKVKRGVYKYVGPDFDANSVNPYEFGTTPANEQREWILPCNTAFYDIENALRALKRIDWRQTTQLNKAQVGDLIYIYCKDKKVSEIRYKGAILAVNKMDNIINDSKYSADGSVSGGPCIEIAVFREYELTDALTYAKLKEHGLLSRLQGPTVVKGSVAEYLHECDDLQRNADRFLGDIPDTCLYPFPIPVYEILSEKKAPKALDNSHSEEEKEEHAKELSLDELRVIASGQSTKKPKEVKTTVTQISRDPYIAEYAKKRANGFCQLCGNKAPFNRADGEPYLESHHIKWLSEGGEDSIENTVALCPNCHKKMHIVKDQNDVNKLLEANAKFFEK